MMPERAKREAIASQRPTEVLRKGFCVVAPIFLANTFFALYHLDLGMTSLSECGLTCGMWVFSLTFLVLSFVQTVLTDAGHPPSNWPVEPTAIEHEMNEVEAEDAMDSQWIDHRISLFFDGVVATEAGDGAATSERATPGGIRRRDQDSGPDGIGGENAGMNRHAHTNHVAWCRLCGCQRTPRVFHCTKCDRCVRKMDHHSDWLGKCIGYKNEKYYLLTVVYTMLNCSVMAGSLLVSGRLFSSLSDIQKNENMARVTVFFIAILGLRNTLSSVMTKALLIIVDLTRRESLMFFRLLERRRYDPRWYYAIHPYDSGDAWVNLQKIFGVYTWYWPIPASMHTHEPDPDGAYFLSVPDYFVREKIADGDGVYDSDEVMLVDSKFHFTYAIRVALGLALRPSSVRQGNTPDSRGGAAHHGHSHGAGTAAQHQCCEGTSV